MLSDILGRKGIPVAILPLKGTENGKISSTEIKNAVERGDIAYANARLTEPYFMLGKVGHAHGRGSTFGYPTANIPFGEDRLPPADGVYITSVTLDGKPTSAAQTSGRSRLSATSARRSKPSFWISTATYMAKKSNLPFTSVCAT